MKSDWKECCLGDIVSLVIDHRGLTPKKLGGDWSDIGFRALSAKNVKTGRIVQHESIRCVSGDMYKKWMPEEIVQGDILITSEAPFGQIYQWNSDEKIVLSQRLFAVRISKEYDANYIYYYMTSDDFQSEMHARATGTTVVGLRQPELLKCTIKYPPLSVQKSISHILRKIDCKIELNEKINQNLAQQLELIYNEMYPYDIASIPDGWKAVSLGDICESVSVKHDFNKEELIFLNTGDIENGCFLHSDYSPVESMPGQAKKSINENDILYSEIRPINRHYAYVSFNAKDYVVSTKLMVIRSKGIDPRRLYHYLTSKTVIDELQHEAETRSGTFPQIRFDNIQRLKMIIALPEQEKSFCDILHTYYQKIDANITENQRLSLLRDSILPKLMSGEIDISDLEL